MNLQGPLGAHKPRQDSWPFKEMQYPEAGALAQELVSESGAQHWEAIDCMRFLAGGRLATKSLDGRMLVWDTTKSLQLASWKVPHLPSGAMTSTPSGRHLAHADTIQFVKH